MASPASMPSSPPTEPAQPSPPLPFEPGPSHEERAQKLARVVHTALLEAPVPPTKLATVSFRQVARRFWWAFGLLAIGAVYLPSSNGRWGCVVAFTGLAYFFAARAARFNQVYASQLVAHRLLELTAAQPEHAKLHLGIYVYVVERDGHQLLLPTPLVKKAHLPASWVEAMLKLTAWSIEQQRQERKPGD